jgi:hypothetical protein
MVAETGPCDHFHDRTTRYNHDQKVLTFLLVCRACGTEKVVEMQDYEPRFEPTSTPQPASEVATVRHLPVGSRERTVRRAA